MISTQRSMRAHLILAAMLAMALPLPSQANAQETRRYRVHTHGRQRTHDVTSLAELDSAPGRWVVEPLGRSPLTPEEMGVLRNLGSNVVGLRVTRLKPGKQALQQLLNVRPWAVLDFSLWSDLTDDSLATLPVMDSLLEVRLDGCAQVSDVGVLAVLKAAPRLRSVDISGLSRVTDEVLVALQGRQLSELRAANCRGIQFALDEALLVSALRNLRVVVLHGCSPAPALFRSLARCERLEEVDLSAVDVTDSDLALALRSARGPIALRVIGCDSLTDEGLLQICVPLVELSADDVPGITTATIRHLVEVSRESLRTLSLFGCEGIDSVAELGRLSALESLDLVGCKGASGFQQVAWEDMRNLAFLSLSATDVSDDDVPALLKAPALRELCLAGTRVTDLAGRLVARHPTLMKLVFTECLAFGDEGFMALATSPGLKEVWVDGSAVSADAASRLAEICPALQVHR